MVKTKISLPDSFFEEEIRNGYTVSPERKKVWAVELDLIIELDRVCKNLGLKYFLDAGSLLGVVRESGFIPWDDDIDVVMFRKDYDLLLKKGAVYFQRPYFLQSAYSDTGYFRGHAQLRNCETTALLLPYEGKRVRFNQGIFIDIFVLDGLSTDKQEVIKQIDEENEFRQKYLYMYQPYGRNWIITVIKKIRACFYKLRYPSLQALYADFENVAKRYSGSQYVDKIAYRNSYSEIHPLKIEWFDNIVYLSFEGLSLPVPNGYRHILEEYFGKDYMIPRQAPTDHGKNMRLLFDTDRAYTEVLKDL